MGSVGLFHLSKCHTCGDRSVMIGYHQHGRENYDDCCKRCYMQAQTNRIQKLFSGAPLRTQDIMHHNHIMEHITSFLCMPYLRPRRLKYLRHLLLPCRYWGPNSTFRQFTFAGNGLAGNVDVHNDIIDVILQFLL